MTDVGASIREVDAGSFIGSGEVRESVLIRRWAYPPLAVHGSEAGSVAKGGQRRQIQRYRLSR
jgi:hypothetical protein